MVGVKKRRESRVIPRCEQRGRQGAKRKKTDEGQFRYVEAEVPGVLPGSMSNRSLTIQSLQERFMLKM